MYLYRCHSCALLNKSSPEYNLQKFKRPGVEDEHTTNVQVHQSICVYHSLVYTCCSTSSSIYRCIPYSLVYTCCSTSSSIYMCIS